MERRLVLIGLGSAALAGCAGLKQATYQAVRVPVDGGAAAAAISRYRASRSVGPVSTDPALTKAAQDHALAIARAGVLSHDLGGSLESRLTSAGAGRMRGAENLASGVTTVEGAMALWRASPGHDRNLLLPDVSRIGIARADAPESRMRHYWALVLTSEA